MVLFTTNSCRKNIPSTGIAYAQTPNLPAVPYPYLAKNGVDSNVATLGRVLFYDRRLSANQAVSCGSCHKQSIAFADNVSFSQGYDGRKTLRNTLPIQNINGFRAVDQGGNGMPDLNNQIFLTLFWDGRQKNLSNMVMNPVNNHIEMSMDDMNSLCARLQQTSFYPDLFLKAFGSSTVTKENIAFAIEAFVQCLQSHHSRFDQSISLNGSTPRPLTAQEQLGFNLFTGKYNCNNCHHISNGGYFDQQLNEFANIGLDINYADNGVGSLTGNASDNGVFRVPSLRNVELTAPYMHDGRYQTLGEVIDHYSEGIQPNRNLSFVFRDLSPYVDSTTGIIDTAGFYNGPVFPLQLHVVDSDKQALLAFLKTLTDYDFVTNPMYSDPFVKP